MIAPGAANVPKITGNLRASIKLKETPNGFQVYIDEGQAPYAEEVNERSHYWQRVGVFIGQYLAQQLGGDGRFID